jgi:dethiobiotin synthetase
LEIIFGKTAVCSAIVKALDHQAFHWEYVKNILLSSSKTRNQVIITAPNKKELMDISVRELDLSQYDHLTSNVEPKDE